MRRINMLLCLLVVCFATAMQAQTPASQPSPELKKLYDFMGGHWTIPGDSKPGPLGPGGKVVEDYHGELILGGSFFQGRWTIKGPSGESQGIEIEAYDPVNKNFVSHWYMSGGSTFIGTSTVSGNTIKWEGKQIVGGKPYLIRISKTLESDLMSGPGKGEVSVDGKTWLPLFECQWTKVKPAPKK